MKNKYTKINWDVERGKKKNTGPKALNRRKTSSVTTNYSLMLQIYLLNKEEAANRGKARFIKATPRKVSFVAKTSAFVMGIGLYFTKMFDYFTRESKASVTMITE